VDVAELRDRAKAELFERGPAPANPRERELWNEERRGAVVLLAALADYDADLLRRAATSEWVRRMRGTCCSPRRRSPGAAEGN
jgi:hypothetical protein